MVDSANSLGIISRARARRTDQRSYWQRARYRCNLTGPAAGWIERGDGYRGWSIGRRIGTDIRSLLDSYAVHEHERAQRSRGAHSRSRRCLALRGALQRGDAMDVTRGAFRRAGRGR